MFALLLQENKGILRLSTERKIVFILFNRVQPAFLEGITMKSHVEQFALYSPRRRVTKFITR